MNKVLISLGSNTGQGKDNITKAIALIREKCQNCNFSSIYQTEAEGLTAKGSYTNCIGLVECEERYEDFCLFFKQTEVDFGRDDLARSKGEVCIDLDILIWNDQVIRERDLQRNFVKQGLSEIRYSR